MFLDDSFEDGRGAGPVPDALGVDDGDRALLTELEAVGLGAADGAVGADEIEFLETPLEEIPGGCARGGIAALGLGGFGAEDDMAAGAVEAEVFEDRGQGRRGGWRCVVGHATSLSEFS